MDRGYTESCHGGREVNEMEITLLRTRTFLHFAFQIKYYFRKIVGSHHGPVRNCRFAADMNRKNRCEF